MRATKVIRTLLCAGALALLSCGQDLPRVEQPGPDALSPDGTASALPLPRENAEPLPVSPTPPTQSWTAAGLGPDLGLVVWSGVNPNDDRPPPPPDDPRSE